MSKVEVQNIEDINNAFKAAVQSVIDFNNSLEWPNVNTFVYREIDGIKIEADVWVRETLSNGDSLAQAAKRPILLYIHGGGWMAGVRTDFPKPILHEFLARGFVFVSIDYRLIPEVDFITGQLDDVRFVETWLREKLQSSLEDRNVNVTVDTDAIVVAGGSAGAHLASLTPKIWKKKPQALLLMAGPTNLLESRRLGRPMAGGKLNEVVEHCPMDPSPEFIKSAMFDGPRTNTKATISVEAFMQPRSLLGLSIFLNEVIADFLVLGVVDGKLPEKGSAPEDKVKFISAYFGDLSDWPPTFQMVGDSDEAWDASQLTSLHDKLKQHNIPSGVLVVPEQSHAFENMSKIGDQLHLRYIQPACEFVARFVTRDSNER